MFKCNINIVMVVYSPKALQIHATSRTKAIMENLSMVPAAGIKS